MDLKIFAGDEDQTFVRKICDYITTVHGNGRVITPNTVEVKKFADGEPWLQFGDNIRGADVFLVQGFGPPEPEVQLFRLFTMIDAAKRSKAGRITAVIPYFGFARQDRKDRSRVPITSKMVVDLLQAMGPDRIITMDMHSNQMEGFFSNEYSPEHLYARYSILPVLRQEARDYKVVSPDAGAIKRCKGYNNRLNQHPLMYVDKDRYEHNRSAVMELVGDIEPGQTALLVDDIIDTGGTLINAAKALKQVKKAGEIFAVGVHGVLSSKAVAQLVDSPIDRVYITDSIARPQEWYENLKTAGKGKFFVVSVAPLFGEAMYLLHTDQSFSPLFV